MADPPAVSPLPRPALDQLESERRRLAKQLRQIAQRTDHLEAEMERIEREREVVAERFIRTEEAIVLCRGVLGDPLRVYERADLSLAERAIVLLGDGRARTVAEIAAATGGQHGPHSSSVGAALSKLVAAGRLAKVAHGCYALVHVSAEAVA